MVGCPAPGGCCDGNGIREVTDAKTRPQLAFPRGAAQDFRCPPSVSGPPPDSPISGRLAGSNSPVSPGATCPQSAQVPDVRSREETSLGLAVNYRVSVGTPCTRTTPASATSRDRREIPIGRQRPSEPPALFVTHSMDTRSVAPRPQVSGWYISSARGGGATKEPGVVARAE